MMTPEMRMREQLLSRHLLLIVQQLDYISLIRMLLMMILERRMKEQLD